MSLFLSHHNVAEPRPTLCDEGPVVHAGAEALHTETGPCRSRSDLLFTQRNQGENFVSDRVRRLRASDSCQEKYSSRTDKGTDADQGASEGLEVACGLVDTIAGKHSVEGFSVLLR